MVKLLIDLLEFLDGCAPLLISVGVLTLLFVLLANSIRKHPTIYYIVLSIPFLLVLVPYILRLFNIETINFVRVPFLGSIIRDYIHMGTFGHPLLIIIMYTGALSTKLTLTKKLYSIRKELSIICGFPVLTHALIRVTNTFPNALRFFTNNSDYLANTPVANEVGAGISNFSFVIGILLVVIFIPLWITSFRSVHKRMGNVKWKKFQRLAYVLYAILFIHAMGIQIGSMMNPRGKSAPQKQVVAESHNTQNNTNATEDGNKKESEQKQEHGSPRQDSTKNTQYASTNTTRENSKPEANQKQEKGSSRQGQGQNQNTQTKKAEEPQTIKTFTDIEVSRNAKGYIHLASILLIYGSYLYLKLKKGKGKKKPKTKQTA